MKIRALSFAVQGALAAMFAMPMMAQAEDDIIMIRRPTNFVEIGIENVSKKSAKFGEYNGLNKSGAELIGNFSVRGGDAYDGGNGTQRWSITGTELGTTSREFGATVGNQGLWTLGIGYGELKHNTTDGYKTPYQGSVGGNNFTLPAGFGLAANTRTMTAAQLAAFQSVDVSNTKKTTSLAAGFNFAPQWNIKLDYNRLDQSGAKVMTFGSDNLGGGTGQKIAYLPNPTNYKTDTIDLSLNWKGDKANLTASYFGSFFRDAYDRVTWTNFAGANATNTMTTAPSNNFHQLNLTGGYALAAKTKLVGGFSYARNTQNDSFVASGLSQTPMPVSSLNGMVKTTHANLKVTDRTIQNLDLSAGIKYDKRDNTTASNIYDFFAINGGDRATYPNTPMSNKKLQLNLAGDYSLTKTQHIVLAYDREEVRRWCNNYAVNANYPAGTNCVVAKAATDDKLGLTYKLKASDDLNLNAGYALSKKRTNFDTNAVVAMIGKNGGASTNTITGLNGGDYLGFHPLFDANRNEGVLKAGVNWQATDRLSVVVGGRYTDLKYDTTYGTKKGTKQSLNLDTTYAYSEKGSFSAYVSQNNRMRSMTDLARGGTTVAASAATATALGIAVGSTWTETLNEDDTTIGLGFKQGGMLGGKLELVGDLTYSLSKTSQFTSLGAGYTNTTTGLTCNDPSLFSCGALPDVRAATTQFKLVGTYDLDKSSKVSLGYLYKRLSADNYYYNGLQTGFTPTGLLPTDQQPGSYSVSVVGVSYLYSFK